MAARRRRSVEIVIAAVGRVTRTVRAVNRQFDSMLRPIRNVRRAADRLRQSTEFRALGRSLRGLGGIVRRFGFLAAAGFGAASVAIRRFIGLGDDVAKTADKLGVGVEALQELRFAAQRTGVEQSTFDMALQRFTRRAAEAASGTGEARGALKFLGIQLRDTRGEIRPTEDLFADVADAMQRIENPALRLRVAFKLFDSEGAVLVNTLAGGSDELNRLRQEARDLGGIMDEETARAAEELEDRIADLTLGIRGMFFQISRELLPVVHDTVRGMLDWIRENREWIRTDLPQNVRMVAEGVRDLLALVTRIVPRVVEFVNAIGGLRTIFIALAVVLAGKLALALIGVVTAIAAIGAVPLLIAAAVAAIVAGAALVLTHWEPIREFFLDLAGIIRDKVMVAVDFWRGVAERLGLADPVVNAQLAGAPAQPLQGLAAASGVQSVAEVRGQVGVRIDVAGDANARVTDVDAGGDLDIAADVGPLGGGLL